MESQSFSTIPGMLQSVLNRYRNSRALNYKRLGHWERVSTEEFVEQVRRLSLGLKNLLGVITSPGRIHSNLGQRTADLASLVRPTLTVVDAVRTLMKHGPTGGNLADVRLTNTVIASHDMVAADAYAATLFNLSGADIAYVAAAADMGLGTLDLDQVDVQELSA